MEISPLSAVRLGLFRSRLYPTVPPAQDRVVNGEMFSFLIDRSCIVSWQPVSFRSAEPSPSLSAPSEQEPGTANASGVLAALAGLEPRNASVPSHQPSPSLSEVPTQTGASLSAVWKWPSGTLACRPKSQSSPMLSLAGPPSTGCWPTSLAAGGPATSETSDWLSGPAVIPLASCGQLSPRLR